MRSVPILSGLLLLQPISSFVLKPTKSRRLGLQMSKSDVQVMVNGMPGPMAVAAAEACLRKGLKLCPIALTGPDVASHTITVTDEDSNASSDVTLIPSNDIDLIDSSMQGLSDIIAIDFTHPSAVNTNALFYIGKNIPFVMGTTGGDRDKLMQDVNNAKLFAVIAPNMAKQIVAMQMALQDLAHRFPASFDGYKLSVTVRLIFESLLNLFSKFVNLKGKSSKDQS